MEYNSQKEDLVMPEYGRNIQELIKYTKTIEDPEYRQAFAEKIIDLMQQMHLQNRNLDDYRVKLWKHIFHIAKYDLNIIPPNGIIPVRADHRRKPDIIDYPAKETKFRHYGSNVQRLVRKALEMEDGPKKVGFVAAIGSYMKLAYRTWNKEHFVSDEVVKTDLATLSNGKLVLPDDTPIDQLAISSRRRSSKRNGGSGNGYSKPRGLKGRRRK